MSAIRSAVRLLACLALSLVTPAVMAATSTVDATLDSGVFSSLQLNAGKPVIAYPQSGAIKLATCTAGCTTATPTWVIATVDTGITPKLALNAGNPVVSYTSAGALKVATCTAGCETATPTWVYATVEPSNVGYQAIAVIDGRPVLAWQELFSANDLWLATCVAGCATATPTWVKARVDDGADGNFMPVHQHISIQSSAGKPVLAYHKFNDGSLNLATCTAGCDTLTPTWVTSQVDGAVSGAPNSLQLNGAAPVIAYREFLNRDLKLATCTASCDTPSANWVRATIESAGDVGGGPSLQFSGGLPLVSYYDVTNKKLKLASCTAGCATATPTWSFTTVDDGGDNSASTSLQLAGSIPMVSYYEAGNGDLRFAALVPPAPVLQLSATSLDFGTLSLGTTSEPQVVTLTNVGGSTLTLQMDQTPYLIVNAFSCTSLAPGASCTLPVKFSAFTLPGSALNSVFNASQSLHITSNATGSPHHVTAVAIVEKSLVQHYYTSILRRTPDAGGREFWRSETTRVTNLGANVNEVWFAMAQSFFASAEYLALNRDNPGFVTDLYRTFYSRDPDQGGLDFWVGQRVAGLPREVLLAAFMFSPEFATFTQSAYGNIAARAEVDAVMDFYRGLLSRLPDDGGFSFWVNRFRAAQCLGAAAVTSEAEAISKAFADSGEYTARGRNNAQYVGDLYNAFLRRGGDLNGVQFWVDQVATGARTRDQVRIEFRNSPEFQARVQAIVNGPCPCGCPPPS